MSGKSLVIPACGARGVWKSHRIACGSFTVGRLEMDDVSIGGRLGERIRYF